MESSIVNAHRFTRLTIQGGVAQIFAKIPEGDILAFWTKSQGVHYFWFYLQVFRKFAGEGGLCHTPLPPHLTLCTYDYAINIVRCLNFLVPRSKIFLKYFPFFKESQNLSLTI
jgi:hypothetical protein